MNVVYDGSMEIENWTDDSIVSPVVRMNVVYGGSMEIENWTDDSFVLPVVFVPPVRTSITSAASSSSITALSAATLSAVASSAACVSTSSHPHLVSSPIDRKMPR